MAIMDTCKADLLRTAALGEVLPYLQHLPADKVRTGPCGGPNSVLMMSLLFDSLLFQALTCSNK
jgi:hypothetical protein